MYKISKTDTDDILFVKREDGAVIPPVENNRDYQAFLAWVAEGNTPEPWTGE